MEKRLKRFVDILGSLVGIVILSPIVLLAGLAIRLESRGGAMLRQTRVGRDRRPFVLFKLRTMWFDAPIDATHRISPDEITGVGRLLRTFKIDELPQLVNVLRGEMSLVGPRPCLPTQTELIEARTRLGVYQALPGITGLAQVEGIDMAYPTQLAARDADYIKLASASLDMRLIVATILTARKAPLKEEG